LLANVGSRRREKGTQMFAEARTMGERDVLCRKTKNIIEQRADQGRTLQKSQGQTGGRISRVSRALGWVQKERSDQRKEC